MASAPLPLFADQPSLSADVLESFAAPRSVMAPSQWPRRDATPASGGHPSRTMPAWPASASPSPARPGVHGLAPIPATQEALATAGLTGNDIDCVELNGGHGVSLVIEAI